MPEIFGVGDHLEQLGAIGGVAIHQSIKVLNQLRLRLLRSTERKLCLRIGTQRSLRLQDRDEGATQQKGQNRAQYCAHSQSIFHR